MIKVTRTNKPDVLEQNATAWTAIYLNAKKEFEQNPTPENKKIVETAEKKYNHLEVKLTLKQMFSSKCAYCESNVPHVYPADIEHYRPKSKFPEFCFDWDNLLYACSICNGKSNKGDKFPSENEGGFIVNPVKENPDDFFKFEFDSNTKQFTVIPLNSRAITTLKIINLNRDDLIDFRTRQLLRIMNTISLIGNDNEKLKLFFNLFSKTDEFYAFIKHIIEKSTI